MRHGRPVPPLMKRLVSGIEVEVGAEAAYFAMLGLKNVFNCFPSRCHPTHLRNASCHMLFTFRGVSVAVRCRSSTRSCSRRSSTIATSVTTTTSLHRILTLSEEAYDMKFETLLLFLVEAIGVPVLLSLLLLTYSNTTGGDVIDLDELPEGRLQLYKLGIMSGIKKRCVIDPVARRRGRRTAGAGHAEEEAAAAEKPAEARAAQGGA